MTLVFKVKFRGLGWQVIVAKMTTISKQPWEAKKDEIIQQMLLLDATQLAEVCGTASVIIPPAKAGDRSRIYNLLLTHLVSDLILI